jgi:hypothetical protein
MRFLGQEPIEMTKLVSIVEEVYLMNLGFAIFFCLVILKQTEQYFISNRYIEDFLIISLYFESLFSHIYLSIIS